MRWVLMILVVFATACGGTASDISAPSSAPLADESTTSQPDTTTTAEESENPVSTDSPSTTREDAADSPTADLPGAPDFTLELGTGGEYTLSSSENPVYLVFWAEW